MAKKGGPEIFLRSEGGPRKIFAINIFCIRPPLTSVCERSLTLGPNSYTLCACVSHTSGVLRFADYMGTTKWKLRHSEYCIPLQNFANCQ